MRGKSYKFREIDKIMRRNGFECLGAKKTSHFKYTKDGKIVVINKNIQEPVFLRIIKENNLNLNA